MARATAASHDQLAALYERNFPGLFDFALRVVRNRDLAADAVHKTFSNASQGAVENVQDRLYSVARTCALDALHGRRRLAGSGQNEREGLDFTQVDAQKLSEPSAVVFDRELVELVWDSAAALNPDDYSLLDLHVRRGLGPDELAPHVGLSADVLQWKLSRLRDSFEEAVGSTLLATRGRRSCERLDAVLSGVESGTLGLRRAAQQHVRGCAHCQESRRRFVPAAEVFGSLALMVATPGVRERIWERLERDARQRPMGRRRRRVFFWR